MPMWKASAPANIAIIKYMGKEPGNRAVNPSLSMTLSNFLTQVELEIIEGQADRWAPLPGSSPLRVESTRKFMSFFERLKKENDVAHYFEVRSGNNFPSDAGLASSASSFAALTKAAFHAFSDLKKTALPSPLHQALVSRSGSGSSCRSFFGPWCAWVGDEIFAAPSQLPPMRDFVFVMEEGFKKVSSSEAHQRVRTSPLFAERSARVEKRMNQAMKCLASGDINALAAISWDELWDMHSLFHTSQPPFFYFAPDTLRVLRWMEEFEGNLRPIVTIDAGPNVHVLVPEFFAKEFSLLAREKVPSLKVLESPA